MAMAWHQPVLICLDLEGRWPRSGSFGGADRVFDAGVGAVAGVELLQGQAGGGGDDAAVLVSVEVEQGGLFAGGQTGVAHDHP